MSPVGVDGIVIGIIALALSKHCVAVHTRSCCIWCMICSIDRWLRMLLNDMQISRNMDFYSTEQKNARHSSWLTVRSHRPYSRGCAQRVPVGVRSGRRLAFKASCKEQNVSIALASTDSQR